MGTDRHVICIMHHHGIQIAIIPSIYPVLSLGLGGGLCQVHDLHLHSKDAEFGILNRRMQRSMQRLIEDLARMAGINDPIIP